MRELEFNEFIYNCNLVRYDFRLYSWSGSKKTAKTLDRTVKHGHVTVCFAVKTPAEKRRA